MPKLLIPEPPKRILPKGKLPIDTSTLIVDDGAPVDNQYAEKQMTLLTEPLNSTWKAPNGRRFSAVSDVGVFFEDDTAHPLVPDAMLTLDYPEIDLDSSDSRSFFTWIIGKLPDVAIEIVSLESSGEDTEKMRKYEARGFPNYVVYDPFDRLKAGPLRVFKLVRKKYRPNDAATFPELGLSLKLWEGTYAQWNRRWLRWCNLAGRVIPSGAELAEAERKEKRVAQDEIKRLTEKLRSAGLEP